MIKKVILIGMGPGDVKYLTLEAVDTIKRLDVFLIPGKKDQKRELTQIRKEILSKVKGNAEYRVIEVNFPERKKGVRYEETVEEWRKKKQDMLKELILKEDAEVAGFLIWGDPSIYDGHIAIFQGLKEEVGVEFEVVPGISSYQLLSAKHKVPFTDVAGNLIFTTPRGLKKQDKVSENTVVFLDNYETYTRINDQGIEIYWGAYLGTKDEVILSGKLSEVKEKIRDLRRRLRKEKGWIMELYFLKVNKDEKD